MAVPIIGVHHVNLQVDDLVAARWFYGDVLGLVEIDRLQGLTFPGAGHQAFLRDPSGNLIELNQPEETLTG